MAEGRASHFIRHSFLRTINRIIRCSISTLALFCAGCLTSYSPFASIIHTRNNLIALFVFDFECLVFNIPLADFLGINSNIIRITAIIRIRIMNHRFALLILTVS